MRNLWRLAICPAAVLAATALTPASLASEFPAIIPLSSLDGKNGFRLDGVNSNDHSGSSVASAGDLNGDGFGDIMIGASRAHPGGKSYAGESYVVFGKATGFASAISLGSLNGTNGFRLNGIDAQDQSGCSVASAGDVNGDGFSDIVIGAMEGDPGVNSPAGESYVVFGKASGFASAINLGSLNGTDGFRLDGIDSDDFSGRSVASAGDVNGDGFDDILIGAPLADPNGDSSAGESYVVFGKASGFASAFNLGSLSGTNGFRLDGIDPSDVSGYSVASAGDVNGDGFGDIVIGAYNSDPNGVLDSGESYVVFGKASGFTSAIDLANLDGSNGFRLDGTNVYHASGQSVASAGDVNGDGFDDILIGATGGNPGGKSHAGQSYVVFGRAPDATVTRVGSDAGQYIGGGAFADKLSGLGGNDVLEGRGGGDVLIGGAGSDTASYFFAARTVTASLATPANNSGAAAGDSYTSIENLTGSQFDDRLTGDGHPNRVMGAKGADILTGGNGPDVFAYLKVGDSLPGAGRDRITDFNAGSAGTSVDHIDLSAIDAMTGPGNQAFTFIGTAPFMLGVKGRLRVRPSGTAAIIEGDVNGDAVADFEIGLANFTDLTRLTSIDFIR